jgi:hypothetical protein
MGLFDIFGEIFFLWKFLLIVVLSGWIFTRVGSKLLATSMVCFVFWIVLTNNWLAMVVTGLYLFISYVIPHGFESMVMIQSGHGLIERDKAYKQQIDAAQQQRAYEQQQQMRQMYEG